jgi:hypothetical protein
VVEYKFIFFDYFITIKKLILQVMLILIFPRKSSLNLLKLIDYKFKILGVRFI